MFLVCAGLSLLSFSVVGQNSEPKASPTAAAAIIYGLKSPKSTSEEIAAGQELLRGGEMAKAKDTFRGISLQSGKSSEEATLRLAQIYYAEGNLGDAQALCEKETSRSVSLFLPQFYCILGDIYSEKNKENDAALAYLRVSLLFVKSRFRPEAMYKAALLFDELEEEERAEELRKELVKSHPKSSYAQMVLQGQEDGKGPDGNSP